MITNEQLKYLADDKTQCVAIWSANDHKELLHGLSPLASELLQARQTIAVLTERLKAAQDDAEWLALILRAIRNHREEIAQYIPTGIDDVLSRHEALVAQEAE
jgi:hypothetical protein